MAWGELFKLYESHLLICIIGNIKLYDFNKFCLTLTLYNQLRGPWLLQLFTGFILKSRKKYLLYNGLSHEETYVKKLDISWCKQEKMVLARCVSYNNLVWGVSEWMLTWKKTRVMGWTWQFPQNNLSWGFGLPSPSCSRSHLGYFQVVVHLSCSIMFLIQIITQDRGHMLTGPASLVLFCADGES